MNWFSLWKKDIKNGIDSDYYNSFLDFLDTNVNSILEKGSITDVAEAISLLSLIDAGHLIQHMPNNRYLHLFKPADVPVFSTFEIGVKRINELLFFESSGMTFEELGYQVVKAPQKGANIKYGENHAKLAKYFSLVLFSRTRPTRVTNSSIGNYLVRCEDELREDMLRKLVLRVPFIQHLIVKAMNGRVSYKEEVSFLSEKTALRRKGNVKQLMEFGLNQTSYKYLLKRVEW